MITALSPSDATITVFLTNPSPSPGEVITVNVTFNSKVNQELEIYAIGIHADWMAPDSFYGPSFSNESATVTGNGVYSTRFTATIPIGTSFGAHTYFVGVEGVDSNGTAFSFDSTQATIQVVAASSTTSTPSPTTNPTTQPTTNPTATPEPKMKTSLEISCKSSTIYSSFKVDIQGHLAANNLGVPDSPVLIAYSVDGGKSWTPLTLVNTDNTGNFSAVWIPSVTGSYFLRGTYEGDSSYSSVTTIIHFTVLPIEENSVFSVTSNSTVTALTFNSTSQELTFKVSGESGTTGYVNFYISKSILSDASTLKVYLDERLLPYVFESQGDSWLVSFAYQHSTHFVTLELNNASITSTYPSQCLVYAIIAVVIVVVLITTIFILRKRIGKS